VLITHRQLCRLTSAWMQERGIVWLACWELGLAVGVLDTIGISSPGTSDELVAYDRWRTDVLMERARRGKRGLPGAWTRTTPAQPEIRIAECKVTRADLLADLRAGKMLAYEQLATHCYLSLGPDLVAWFAKRAKTDLRNGKVWARHIREDLTDRGLPKHWGIVVVVPNGRGGYDEPKTIRGARRIANRSPDLVRYIGWRMAKSTMARVLGPSPLDVLQPEEPQTRTADVETPP
jgi:hypothetical protein